MTALNGVRVLELANESNAFAGKLLGDMGADVILIEPVSGEPSRAYPPFVDEQPGDNQSLYFMHYNTSKRSMILDLETQGGQTTFKQLIKSTDVLLESEPVNRLGKLSLDYKDLVKIQPTLIHAAITPYGRDQAQSDLPVTDLTLMASSGPPWSCGYDDHDLPPVRGWGQQAYHTGCHYAFMSILTALLYRNVSGQGQFIDVSISAALNVTTEAASYSWLVSGATVQRQTGRHAAIKPTAESQVKCADGRYVNTGVPPRFPEEFGRLLTWLRETGLDKDFPEAVFLDMGANWQGPFDLSQIGEDETITAIFMAGRQALIKIANSISAYDFFIG